MKIGVVAGEASGDALGAKLIAQLREHIPGVEFVGVGGPAMAAEGCTLLADMERLAVMGLIEPLFSIFDLIKLRKSLYKYFQQNRPDVFIGIDAPDFNLGLELQLKKIGIPTVHYVSPSVWAWRQGRIKKIAKAVDLMLTLFPFEAKYYEQKNIPVLHVGHPLAQQIAINPDVKAARRALGVEEDGFYVALLPGSRKQELNYMSREFLLAALRLQKEMPHIHFLTTHVNEDRYQQFYVFCKQHAPNLRIKFFTRHSAEVISAADVVMVTSGTATLEAMLYKKPMVIIYRMANVTFRIAKWLVKIPYIGLPNLLAQKKLVPELIQTNASAANIADEIKKFMNSPSQVDALQQEFVAIHETLRVPESAKLIAANIRKLCNLK